VGLVKEQGYLCTTCSTVCHFECKVIGSVVKISSFSISSSLFSFSRKLKN
jgi:hypothetical protein